MIFLRSGLVASQSDTRGEVPSLTPWGIAARERTCPPASKAPRRRGGNLIGKVTFAQIEFATDSPLEEAVSSEPVSENRKFPASWVNTGKFIDFGL